MKKIIFNNKVLDVADETNEYYICYPKNNEGYDWIKKSGDVKEC